MTVFPLIYAIANPPAFILLLIIISYAIISDFLDGFIARKYQQNSGFGKILDPIADGTLVLASLITMSIYNLLPIWFCILNLTRYTWLILIALPQLKQGHSLQSNFLGKCSATLTTITLSIYLLFPQSPAWLKTSCLTISTAFLIYSWYSYLFSFKTTLYQRSN